MPQKNSFSDASEVLLYFDDRLDTRRSLWFCRDVLDVDAVKDNAACLGIGVDDLSSLRSCEAFLRSFPSIFIAVPEEDVRATLVEALDEYVPGLRILLPREGAFGKHDRVRDILETGGQPAVDRLLSDAVERPMKGLLDLSEVEHMDPSAIPSVLSGIPALDNLIGGFYPGELSVWTGKRGGGKSTLLGQLLIEAVNQGQRVCAYSGELAAWRFREWIYLQAAGPNNIEAKTDPFSGREFYTVSPMVEKRLDEWFKGSFFLYDNSAPGGSNEDSILSIFDYAVRRHGCSVFLVDNLMSSRFGTSSDKDFYRAQSNFVGRLVEFAKQEETHLHLVAHPRKGDGKFLSDADEVGGSGDITNRADNVFSLQRLSDQEAEKQGCQSVLRVLKNRAFGATAAIGMDYDVPSRRFFRAGTGNPGKQYGWERSGQQTAIKLPDVPGGGPF